MERVDIVTGTFGKALGGAMGGYTTGKKEIIEILKIGNYRAFILTFILLHLKN